MHNDIRLYDFVKTIGRNTTIVVKNPGELDEDPRKWPDADMYGKAVLAADIEYVRGQLVLAITLASGDVTPTLFPR